MFQVLIKKKLKYKYMYKYMNYEQYISFENDSKGWTNLLKPKYIKPQASTRIRKFC